MNATVVNENTPLTAPARRGTRKGNTARWLVPAGLVLLSLIPAGGGVARLMQLFGGAEITPANARFFDMPLPVIIHIFGALIYSLMGAFHFPQGLRPRHLKWHRYAGYVLTAAGLAVALSGLWMSHFYDLPASDGELLYIFRWIFGIGMTASIVLGFLIALRRDIFAHRAWMLRAYAIGMGAGTQAFTHLPYMILVGVPGVFVRALLMLAGWLINLAVAEWVIAKRRRRIQTARAAA